MRGLSSLALDMRDFAVLVAVFTVSGLLMQRYAKLNVSCIES